MAALLVGEFCSSAKLWSCDKRKATLPPHYMFLLFTVLHLVHQATLSESRKVVGFQQGDIAKRSIASGDLADGTENRGRTVTARQIQEMIDDMNVTYSDYCDISHSSLPGVDHLSEAKTKCQEFAVNYWTNNPGHVDVMCAASLKQLYLRLKLFHTALSKIVQILPSLTGSSLCSKAYVSRLENNSLKYVDTWRPEKLLYCNLERTSLVEQLENVLGKIRVKLLQMGVISLDSEGGNPSIDSSDGTHSTVRRSSMAALYIMLEQLHRSQDTLVDVLSS